MSILLAAMLFLQAVVPDQLANVVPDQSGDYPADLSFADGTQWGIVYKQNCDWITTGQQVIWSPLADGSVASLVLPGSDQFCYVDTVAL